MMYDKEPLTLDKLIPNKMYLLLSKYRLSPYNTIVISEIDKDKEILYLSSDVVYTPINNRLRELGIGVNKNNEGRTGIIGSDGISRLLWSDLTKKKETIHEILEF